MSKQTKRTRNVLKWLDKSVSGSSKILGLILGVVFLYMISTVAISADVSTRMVAIRYFNFLLCGLFAFAIPHILFPDQRRSLAQMFNLDEKSLLNLSLRPFISWLFFILAAFLILAFLDTGRFSEDLDRKLFAMLYGVVFAVGIGLLSLVRYLSIGPLSQEWQEGDKGRKLNEKLNQTGFSTGVPSGSWPTLITTTSVTAGGMLTVVAGAWLAGVSGIFWVEIVPAGLSLVLGLSRIASIRKGFDQVYYQTNAFFQELFKNPKAVQEGREPVHYDALYWIPRRWRAATWFSLLQLDRKIPAGRLLIVAHLILWVIFYSGIPMVFVNAFILLIITGKSLIPYLLTKPAFSPGVFQMKILPPADWILVRFFANLRWVLLLILSLWIVSLFTERMDWQAIYFWMITDVVISFVSGLIFTLIHEFKFKHKYA